MSNDDQSLEPRLRRAFAAVAETPLDAPPEAAEGWHPRRARRLLVAGAAAAGLVVGAVAIAPDRSPRETVAATGDSERTLADYQPSREEAATLFRAEQRATRRCMEAAEQPYQEVSPDAFTDLDRHWSRLGRTDRDRADRLGYVVPPGPGGRHPSQEQLRSDAERDAWSRALTGGDYSGSSPETGPSVPVVHPVTGEENGRQVAGGCFGEVQRDLYGDQSRHTSLESFIVNELRGRVDQSVVADRRASAAIDAWSQCMKGRGHEYEDPHGPITKFGVDPAPGRPTADERRIALDDVDCKDEVRLVATWDQLDREYGRHVAAEHERYVTEFRTIVDLALGRAEEILADP